MVNVSLRLSVGGCGWMVGGWVGGDAAVTSADAAATAGCRGEEAEPGRSPGNWMLFAAR